MFIPKLIWGGTEEQTHEETNKQTTNNYSIFKDKLSLPLGACIISQAIGMVKWLF